MLRRSSGFLLLAALTLAPVAASAQIDSGSKQAAQATAVADQLMQALGGQKAWDDTHYLRFTFAGRRTHHWDKWTGRHRVEGQTQDGKHYVILENINTHEGEAWVDGKKVEADKMKEWLDRGYGTWVNDTYWLLMPYKLRDPGVNLTYAGQETVDGVAYDKLHLSFGKVGLTPGDQYWAWINPGTHLMDRWAYLLQTQPGKEQDKEPTTWQWKGWQRFGQIQLAPTREMVGGEGKLELSDLAVFDTLPDSVFTSPDPIAK
jgi:hypothetical protein